jgi:Holliday junction resolvase
MMEAAVAALKAKGHFSSEAQSKRRRNQIAAEVDQAKQLEAEGYEVFSPTVVCDRVAVKDGKVFFVEFKKNRKQKLRPGQSRIHKLVPEMYLIRYK